MSVLGIQSVLASGAPAFDLRGQVGLVVEPADFCANAVFLSGILDTSVFDRAAWPSTCMAVFAGQSDRGGQES